MAEIPATQEAPELWVIERFAGWLRRIAIVVGHCCKRKYDRPTASRRGLGLADSWLCSKPNPTQNPRDGCQSARRHQTLNGYGDRLISGLLHHQGHDLDSIQFFDKLTHKYSPDGRRYVMV